MGEKIYKAYFSAFACDTRFDHPMEMVCGRNVVVGEQITIVINTVTEVDADYLSRMAKEIEALPPVGNIYYKNVKPLNSEVSSHQ